MLALLLGVIHFGTLFTGIAFVDAATASIIIQIQVPLSALAAAAFFGDRIGWRRWSGMALSIAGIALLVGRPAFQGGWIGVTLIPRGLGLLGRRQYADQAASPPMWAAGS